MLPLSPKHALSAFKVRAGTFVAQLSVLRQEKTTALGFPREERENGPMAEHCTNPKAELKATHWQ